MRLLVLGPPDGVSHRGARPALAVDLGGNRQAEEREHGQDDPEAFQHGRQGALLVSAPLRPARPTPLPHGRHGASGVHEQQPLSVLQRKVTP